MAEHAWQLSYMPPHDTVREGIEVWKACEDAGLDVLGPADSQNLLREMVVCLTAIALSTSRARIMSYATNPITRHPTVMAGAFVALNELAPGRMMFGIATGDSAIWSMARSPSKLQLLRDYTVAVKRLCRGEDITWDGHTFKPAWSFEPFDLPTYLMCSGPKVLRLAAEIADGAVVHMGFAPEDLADVRRIIDEGRRAVGKDPATFDVWWNAPLVFDESYDAAAKRSLGWMPRWLTMGSLEGKGIPEDYKEKVKQLNADQHNLKVVYRGKNREAQLVDRARELGLYDWLMSRSPRLLGTSEGVAERMNELARTEGLTQWILFLYGQTSDPTAATHQERLRMVNKFSQEVMTRLD